MTGHGTTVARVETPHGPVEVVLTYAWARCVRPDCGRVESVAGHAEGDGPAMFDGLVSEWSEDDECPRCRAESDATRYPKGARTPREGGHGSM